MSETFAAPYTSTLLMCFMGSIECGAIALISDHKLSDWSLSSPLRLISAIYAVSPYTYTMISRSLDNNILS